MLTVALWVFWISAAVCVYVYFGYPALLLVLSRLRPREVQSSDATPSVTFVIAAYNEERNIAAKLENTLSLDYPASAMEVLVLSNGSTDRTNAIVAAWPDARVRLIALPQPGKANALNEGARQAKGDVLVFSDADFFLDPHTLRLLASRFGDPSVGGVCGARNTTRHRDGDATSDGEGLYARWDKWQKVRESEIGSVFAADGLLYAVRRSLYVPIADPAQADDMAISMRIPVQGFRLLFEPQATAWETAAVHAHEEFGRKVRITAHSVRALFKLGWPLVTTGFYSVELISHKLVRHFIPFFLLSLLVANIPLATRSPFYAAALAAQGLLYLLAIAGSLLRSHPLGHRKFFAVPYFFCFVNAAAFLGILSMLRKHEVAAWSSRAEPVTIVEKSS